MDIFTVTLMVSILIFVAIGSYSGRSVKKLDDYFVAGRRAPTLFIVGTLVASVFSTSIFMGEAGFTYDGQFGPYILMPGLAVVGYVYGALLFGTFLRRSRAPTVAEFFGRRFNSHRVQQASGITIIIGLGGYLLVVTQGAGILLSDLTGGRKINRTPQTITQFNSLGVATEDLAAASYVVEQAVAQGIGVELPFA